MSSIVSECGILSTALMRMIKFLYLLLILPAAVQVLGQGENSICGYIESGRMTIPSYKFVVVDRDGHKRKNLRGKGELEITEGVWQQNGWLDVDPYYKEVNHNITIPIIYDEKEGVYATQEIPNLKITLRKKGPWFSKSKCWDKVQRLEFEFTDENGDHAVFLFFFKN